MAFSQPLLLTWVFCCCCWERLSNFINVNWKQIWVFTARFFIPSPCQENRGRIGKWLHNTGGVHTVDFHPVGVCVFTYACVSVSLCLTLRGEAEGRFIWKALRDVPVLALPVLFSSNSQLFFCTKNWPQFELVLRRIDQRLHMLVFFSRRRALGV